MMFTGGSHNRRKPNSAQRRYERDRISYHEVIIEKEMSKKISVEARSVKSKLKYIFYNNGVKYNLKVGRCCMEHRCVIN